MKIILVDLPFPYVSFSCECPFCVEWLGNSSIKKVIIPPPLGLGYIASAIKCDEKLKKNVEILIWGAETTTFLTPSQIARRLLLESPDIIGFSTYLWNSHEVVEVIKKLREEKAESKLILGGPEILGNVPQFLDSQNGADILIKGEGEITFREVAKYLRKHNKNLDGLEKISGLFFRDSKERIIETPNRKIMNDLNLIPSPYLSGVIDLTKYSVLYLSTYRGCKLRCKFCFYHKNYPYIREYSIERIKKEIQLAIKNGIKNVYIIDATFNEQKRILPLLKMIENENENKELEFFAEIRADLVSNQMAKLFQKANFPLLETGIQTINKKALRIMGRPFNPYLFEKGIKNLQKYKIQTGVDVIIGLPGDNFQTIVNTLAYLARLSIDYIFPYVLSILPGTDFFINAKKYGLQFMRQPPYFVIENFSFSQDEIKRAFRYALKFVQSYVIGHTNFSNFKKKEYIEYFQERMGCGL